MTGDAPKAVLVCSWCPDALEQTVAARAHGFEVSHGMCPACTARINAALDAKDAARAKHERER